jgi:hypothetical protein
MRQARRAGHLGHRLQRVLVEPVDAFGLVAHVERPLPQRVLRGDAHRAMVGVAGLRLDAAEANMKPRAELAQSAPSASALAMSKAVTSLPDAPIFTRSRSPAPRSVLWA